MLARLSFWTSWRDEPNDVLADLPAPRDPSRAAVVTGHAHTSLPMVASTAWAHVARQSVDARAGAHEGVGGMAMAAAVAALVRGSFDECLIIGSAPQRGYALLLRADRS